MIRFLIDKFRNAPGPLKKPRILLADISEEVLDLASHYIKGDAQSTTIDEHSSPAPTSAPEKTAAMSPETDPGTVPAEKKVDVAASNSATSDASLDPALEKALTVPANQKKQIFKIMAILFDCNQKGLGLKSAKEISSHGEKHLEVSIKHENVRKVIRMKLEDYVQVHAQGVGNRTVYKYQISDAGIQYFKETFLMAE